MFLVFCLKLVFSPPSSFCCAYLLDIHSPFPECSHRPSTPPRSMKQDIVKKTFLQSSEKPVAEVRPCGRFGQQPARLADSANPLAVSCSGLGHGMTQKTKQTTKICRVCRQIWHPARQTTRRKRKGKRRTEVCCCAAHDDRTASRTGSETIPPSFFLSRLVTRITQKKEVCANRETSGVACSVGVILVIIAPP